MLINSIVNFFRRGTGTNNPKTNQKGEDLDQGPSLGENPLGFPKDRVKIQYPPEKKAPIQYPPASRDWENDFPLRQFPLSANELLDLVKPPLKQKDILPVEPLGLEVFDSPQNWSYETPGKKYDILLY